MEELKNLNSWILKTIQTNPFYGSTINEKYKIFLDMIDNGKHKDGTYLDIKAECRFFKKNIESMMEIGTIN
tara:strand:- start:161 stop:373 length:213 start_codon:yes stop_codon:yes gene_type:complete